MAPESHRVDIPDQSSSSKQLVTVENRLVRDRIPEIIESQGNIVVWKELDDAQFSRALLDALVRSSQRFADTESLESLADLLELVETWLESRGLSMEEVNRARREKSKRCGTFERRRFVEVVAGAEQADIIASRDPRC